MTKMKDKLMVQDIGIQLSQYCWKRLHKMEHQISRKDFGYTWFMKAVTKKRIEYCKNNNGMAREMACPRQVQGSRTCVCANIFVIGWHTQEGKDEWTRCGTV